MPKRVSIRSIAKLAGVHHSTVSLAMRKHPSIPEETRERILKIAKEVGYRPDPMLTALNSYRREMSHPAFHSTLAWVTNFPTRDDWKDVYTFCQLYEGAAERAEQLGYKLDEFWVGDPEIAHPSKVLWSRNISGLLIAPMPSGVHRIELEWQRFASVAIGYTLAEPHLHIVTNHHFRVILQIMRQLRLLGYRKVGLVIPRSIHERFNGEYLGGFKVAQEPFPAAEQLTALILEGPNPAHDFYRWMDEQKPQAIIAQNTEVLAWLRSAGVAVPRDVGVAITGVHEHKKTPIQLSGITPRSKQVGIAAIEMLTGMLNRGELGVPPVQQCLLIEGVWVEGETTRRIGARSGREPGRNARRKSPAKDKTPSTHHGE